MKYLSMAAILAASTVGVFADDDMSNGTASQPVPSQQHPKQDEMYGFRLAGEALFWKPMIETPILSLEENDAAFTSPFVPATGSAINWKFDWSWGYRLGLDFRFDDCNWGLGLEYSQLYSDATVNQTAAAGNGLFIPNNNFASVMTGAADSVNGKFNNNMNMLDGMLERRYEVGDYVCFYPAFGVKGVWFRQNSHRNFSGGDIIESTMITQKQKFRYYAAGPKVAFASQWDLGCGFGFYEDLGFSMLLGNAHRSFSQAYTADPTYTSNIDIGTVFHLVPALEVRLGLDWVYHFEEVAQCLGLNVGVDAQTYFNEYFASIGETYGNASYFGISFGAFWKF